MITVENEDYATVKLVSFARSLRANGTSEDDLFIKLLEYNYDKLNPSVDEMVVLKIAESVAKYPTLAESMKVILEADYTKLTEVITAENLSVLSEMRRNHPVEYIAFKSKIKDKKLSVRDVENAIKSHDKQFASPSNMMRNDVVNLLGEDYNVPSGYTMSLEDGVHQLTRDGAMSVCFNLVFIAERLINIDTQVEKVRIKFYRDGVWKETVADRTAVFNKATIIKLTNLGLAVSSNNAGRLVAYLDAFEESNRERIKVTKCVSKLGWRGSSFLPYALSERNVVFEPDSDFTIDIMKGIKEKGSIEKWKEGANIVRESSPFGRFMLASSFASPLMKLLEVRTFISYVWCKSKHGKSASIKMGISAFGEPSKLQSSFNTTLVGLERKCAGLNNLPFGIDERQLLDEKKMDVAKICYMLAEEQSKVKGERFGGLAEVLTWRNVVIASGEQSMTNGKVQDGVQTRVLELYGKPLGDAETAREVHILADNNYGMAGRVFIEKLCEYLKTHDIKLEHKRIIDNLKRYKNKSEHLENISAVCLGDYLCSLFVFGESEETTFNNCVAMGKVILENNSEQIRESNSERAYAFIIDWLNVNSHRFEKDSYGDCYGAIVESMFLVIPSVLDKALQDNGFAVEQTIKAMKEKGRLVTKLQCGKDEEKPVRKIRGKSMRVYQIKNDTTEYGNVQMCV
ncbi:MAG: DUF927 domain-containing protein [Bacillota bacterium]